MGRIRVLVACESSGVVRDALISLGVDAMSCDLKPTETPGPHYQGDVRDVLYEQWDGMIAHPVCRYAANSGVRWMATDPTRYGKMVEGAKFFNLFTGAHHIPHRIVENSIIHKHAAALMGRQTQVVQPWWFGEPRFKAAALWLFGVDPLTPTDRLNPPKPGTDEHKVWSVVHRMAPGPEREANRSRTLPGVGMALAKALVAAIDGTQLRKAA
jgi:hypothetical protein